MPRQLSVVLAHTPPPKVMIESARGRCARHYCQRVRVSETGQRQDSTCGSDLWACALKGRDEPAVPGLAWYGGCEACELSDDDVVRVS